MVELLETLYLALCGASGINPKREVSDWQSVLTISVEQNVFPQVYLAVCNGSVAVPPAILA